MGLSGHDATVEVQPLPGFTLEGKRFWGVDPYNEPDVRITFSVPGFVSPLVVAVTWFYVGWDQLALFFRQIDQDWRGWKGEKRFGTGDAPLELTAMHDGKGHVRLWISVANGLTRSGSSFRVSALFMMDVGSAKAAADALDAWITEIGATYG